MKETYKVKRPDRIVWGDPCYMEQYSGSRLKSLIVNVRPPKDFDARVVLETGPTEEYPDAMVNTMTIFLAPRQTMEIYLKGMRYASQEHKEKEIRVDTAKYYLRVDEQADTIYTGGDGCWGIYQELFRRSDRKKILDAAVILIGMPEDETMDSMREYLKYFFEDVEQIENMEEEITKEESESPKQHM